MNEAGVELRRLTNTHFDRPLYALSNEELINSTDACFRLQAIVDGLKVAYVREVRARGIAGRPSLRRTVEWLSDREHISPGVARRLLTLAASLDQNAALHGDPWQDTDPDPDPDPDSDVFELPDGVRSTRDALDAGLLNLEQAAAICKALKELPAEYRPRAETLLVGDAQWFDAAVLHKLGQVILHRVDPEKADQLEGEALRRSEERDYRARELHLGTTQNGGVRISGVFDAADGAILRACIDALCSPRIQGGDDGRTYPQRCADAMVEIFNLALKTRELPDHGGDRPQVVVTMSLKDLQDGIGTATFDDGVRLSATQARVFACDAGIIPAVLGGTGQVLDLGRERRRFTGALRRALNLRDGGCAFPGCDRPPRWTDAYHTTPWHDKGTTCLGNGALVCRPHHRLIHETEWDVRINPLDGLPEFLPPSSVDIYRKPRRNPYRIRR